MTPATDGSGFRESLAIRVQGLGKFSVQGLGKAYRLEFKRA